MKQVVVCQCGSNLFFEFDYTEQCISCAECFSVWLIDDEGYLMPTSAPSPYTEKVKYMMMDVSKKTVHYARNKISIVDMMIE